MRAYFSLVCHPETRYALTHLRRFASNLRLRTDFGNAVPAQRPKSVFKPFYVTEPASKKGSFARFMRSAQTETPYIVGAVLGVIIYSGATLAIPAAFGVLVDHVSNGAMPLGTSLQLGALFVICAVGNFLRLWFIGYSGEAIIAKLRRKLYAAILRQPVAFFDSPENRTGALVQRLSMDCNVVGCSLTESVASGSKNLMQTVGSIGIMLYYSPLLISVIVGLIPPIAIFAGFYGRYVRRLQHNLQSAVADMGTVAEERLSSIRTIKAFATEVKEMGWHSTKVQRVFDLSLKKLTWNAGYIALLQCVSYGAVYCVLWAGSLLLASEQLTSGVFFSFMLYTIYCGIGLTGLTNLATEINKGYGASLRVFDILDEAERMQKKQDATEHLTPVIKDWSVTLKEVSFSYPTRPEVFIYRNLNLTIQAARCTCVVGSSGSGKSSLAMLFLKLYQPTSGTILLGGHDIADIKSQWLREKVGYVAQEPVLFGGSIAQNIAYGIPGRNWDDPIDRWLYASIVDAAIKANAHSFITSLPHGYDTFVGENGRSLSGGQRQRIAIARALVRNPNITILDEATSALDNESEMVVQDAIFKFIEEAKSSVRKSQHTVLMFAHKLSMIRKADHIIVLNKGEVVTEGSFDEVLQNKLFRSLVGLDASNYYIASNLQAQEGLKKR